MYVFRVFDLRTLHKERTLSNGCPDVSVCVCVCVCGKCLFLCVACTDPCVREGEREVK